MSLLLFKSLKRTHGMDLVGKAVKTRFPIRKNNLDIYSILKK
jgi:hypothetical protein